MRKEEILSKQTITNYSGVEFVKPHNALMAMQEYADQETQRLKAELAEKDKEIEISHNENRRMERHFLETVTVINSLRELQTEDLKQLQSELTELKEKHKEDVVGFAEWILKQSDLQNLKMYEDSFVIFKQGSAFGKTLTSAELVDHHNETHKTK